MNFLFVNWHPDHVAFSIGDFPIAWYGILFGMAFALGYWLMGKIFRRESIPNDKLDTLTLWMVGSTFIGARLGHVLFYEPGEYLTHPLRIWNLREGGLASHGAAIGIISGMYLWARFSGKVKFSWIMDRIVIMVALSGLFIRIGNLVNSEIIGGPTSSSIGFVYSRPDAGDQNPPWLYGEMKSDKNILHMEWEKDATGRMFELWYRDAGSEEWKFLDEVGAGKIANVTHSDPPSADVNYELREKGQTRAYASARLVARHPTQIYEATFYLLVFFFLWWMYWRKKDALVPWHLFAWFLILVFGFRFFVEFLKEDQVAFESGMPLNMGQLLSIPFVIAGTVLLLRKPKI